jgi:uncharacterized membrane protein
MKRLILALVIGLFAASAAHAGGRVTGSDFRGTSTASTTSSPSGGHHSSGGQQGGGVTPDGAKPGIGSGSN